MVNCSGVYFTKSADPLSVVVVVGDPVPKGGGRAGDVMVLRESPTKPKLPPLDKKAKSSLELGPVASEQMRFAPSSAMEVVTQLLTIWFAPSISTATGTWHPVTPAGTSTAIWSTPAQQPERP